MASAIGTRDRRTLFANICLPTPDTRLVVDPSILPRKSGIPVFIVALLLTPFAVFGQAVPAPSAPVPPAKSATPTVTPLTAPASVPDATTLDIDVSLDPPAAGPFRAETRLHYLTQTQRGRDTGVPLVSVRLNDTVTATFLLDTGTSVSSVTDTMAAKLGLTPQATLEPATPQIMDGPTATQVPLTIQLGGFRFAGLPTFVIKESRVARVLGSAPDGILGINVLSRLALLLNPQGHALTLLYPGKCSGAELHNLGLGAAGTMLLTPARNGTFWTTLLFKNGDHQGRSNLMVDTGAVTTIVPHSLAEQLALAPLKSNLPTEFGNGDFTADLARMPMLLLGAVNANVSDPASSQLALNNGLVLYAHEPETQKRTPHVLGMNILSGGLLLLDFPGRTVYLAPTTLGAETSQIPQNVGK